MSTKIPKSFGLTVAERASLQNPKLGLKQTTEVQRLRATVEAAPDKVVDTLFVNGDGQHATRLMLVDADDRDLGGWCKGAVRDVIRAALDPPADPSGIAAAVVQAHEEDKS